MTETEKIVFMINQVLASFERRRKIIKDEQDAEQKSIMLDKLLQDQQELREVMAEIAIEIDNTKL